MLDDQFISSPSWLPSPRFELQTLAGYSTVAPVNTMKVYGGEEVRHPFFTMILHGDTLTPGHFWRLDGCGMAPN